MCPRKSIAEKNGPNYENVSFQGYHGQSDLSDSLLNADLEQILFYNRLIDYIEKYNVVKYSGKYRVSYRYYAKPLVRVYFKRNKVTISFCIADERMRLIKRNAVANNVAIVERESELSIDNHNALQIALDIIEMRVCQIEADNLANKKEKSTLKSAKAVNATNDDNIDDTFIEEGDMRSYGSDTAIEETAAADMGNRYQEVSQHTQSIGDSVVRIELLLNLEGLANGQKIVASVVGN